MTFSTKMTHWAFRWFGPPLRISVSVCVVFGMTCARLSNISDYVSFCFPVARIDLSVEDDVVALRLVECSARPYTELIKLDIAGPSNWKPACPDALRPSPPPSKKVSPIGPSAATPTRGEVLAQLEALSREAPECEAEKIGLR